MPLPSSGAISLSQVNVELGRSATANITLNESAVRTLLGVASGTISLSHGYGKSSASYYAVQLSPNTSGADMKATAVDAAGNIYVLITYLASSTANLIKLSKDGSIVWSRVLSVSPVNVNQLPHNAIAVSKNGLYIYAANNYGWVAKYNTSDGTQVWGKGYDSTVTTMYAIAATSGESFITAGWRTVSSGVGGASIYNWDGTAATSNFTKVPATNYAATAILATCVDDAGNIYSAFRLSATAQGICKMNSSGVMQWTKTFGVAFSGTEPWPCIRVDGAGTNVYMSFMTSANSPNIAKFDASTGALSWMKSWVSTGVTSPVMDIDSSGNMYIAYKGTVNGVASSIGMFSVDTNGAYRFGNRMIATAGFSGVGTQRIKSVQFNGGQFTVFYMVTGAASTYYDWSFVFSYPSDRALTQTSFTVGTFTFSNQSIAASVINLATSAIVVSNNTLNNGTAATLTSLSGNTFASGAASATRSTVTIS